MKTTKSLKRYAVALGALILLLGIPDFLGAWVPAAPQGNLQAWYRLDDGSGTSATDSTGNGNSGTLTNGPTWSTSDPAGLSYAVQFDGTDDFIETSKTATNLGINGAGAKTVTAWAFAESFNNGGIFDLGDYKTRENFSLRTRGGDDQWRTQLWGADIDFTYASKNKWVHFALTYDGTIARVYADGIEQGNRTTTLDTTDTVTFRIGRWRNDYFDGRIDEVRVYDRALTASEVEGLATAGGHLGAHWKLDDGAGTNAADDSGNNFDGTLTNGPAWSSSGKRGGALDFDGTDDHVDLGDSLTIVQDVGAATAAGWIKIESLPASGSFQEIISLSVNNSGTPTDTSRLALAIKGDGTGADVFGGARTTDTGGMQSTTDDSTLKADTWYHVAAVYDFGADTIKIYVNGVETKSASVSFTNARTPDTASENAALGAQDGGSGNHFNGLMDDLYVFRRALSATEIKTLATGLVGHWVFDEGTGTTVADDTGNGHTGTFNGGALWGAEGPDGNPYSLETDGSDDYVETSTDATGFGIQAGKAKTVAAWALTESFNNGGIFDLGDYSNGENFSLRTTTTDNQWRVQLWGTGIDFDFTHLSKGKWTHFALTYDGTTAKVYADGVEVASNAASLDTGNTTPFRIGRWRDDYFDGQIDDVRVYNRALPADEVAQLASLPKLLTATSSTSDLTKVVLGFSEDMDKTTAEDTSNYTLTSPLTVSSAVLAGNKQEVTLTASANVTLGTTQVTAKADILSEAGSPISETTLTINQGGGLTGIYFDSLTFGADRVERIDSQVNFDWGTGVPHPSIGKDTFIVLWHGQVLPEHTETYTFYTNTDDGVRLWVNDTLVVDKWIDQGETEHSGTISLTADTKVNIRIEYYENGGNAVAELRWSSASVTKEVIPSANLFPSGYDKKPTFTLAEADAGDLTEVFLHFDEPLDDTSASMASNYTLTGGLTVSSVKLQASRKLVLLKASGNVTTGTSQVTANTGIQGVTGNPIDQTTKIIQAVQTTDLVGLALSTDSNESVVQDAITVNLTVTAPASAGTTATTIDLAQAADNDGTGQILYGSSGESTTATVTTSGGTPNQAEIIVRHKTTSTSKDDMRILALISDAIRGSHRSTMITTTISPKCVYLSDQRGVNQTVTMTPAFANVDFDFEVVMFGGKATTLSPYEGIEGTTDAAGQFTITLRPCGKTSYTMAQQAADGRIGHIFENGPDDHEFYPYECGYPAEPGEGGTQNGIGEVCASCEDHRTSGSVYASTGEKKLDVTDLSIKGRGLNWRFRRVYISHNYRKMLGSRGVQDFGENWYFSYADEYLVKDDVTADDEDSNYVNYRDGSSGVDFPNTGAGKWEVSRALGNFVQFRLNTNLSQFEIREEDGDVRVYHDFSDTSTPNKNGRLKEIRDRNDNFMSFLYDEIDPDGTASNGDEKMVLTRVIDTMGREIRYEYYAATAQSTGGRTLTIVETGTGARGRLARVRDFKGDMDFSDNDASEDFPNQVNNRTLHFDYDSEGNLVRCSGPAVAGTPTSNNFANGKTYRYKYISDANQTANWGTLSADEKDFLRHRLTHIWYPNEVKNTPGSNPADSEAAEVVAYETDPTDDFFGFATSYTVGGQNANGVPSGGTITYTYTEMDPDRAAPAGSGNNPSSVFDIEALKVEVDDRNGNDSELIYGGGRNLLTFCELTKGLRTGEPTEFEITQKHQDDWLLSEVNLPEGNKRAYTYNENSTDRFQQSNMIRIIHTPDAARGADQDKIETVMVYEPIYNRPCLIVQARGSDIDNNDFTPPIADPVDRTMTDPYDATKKLDLRYARVEFFDYQESTEKATNAPDSRLDIDGSGGKVNLSPLITYDADVLTVEVWLVQELGLVETTAGEGLDELRDRLSDNLTNLGLGDLNGDNDTTPAIAGNIIRTIVGSPVLIASSNQHALESAIDGADLIDAAKTYGQGGTNEGSAEADRNRLQTIVWMYRYNEFGQLLQALSPEGNVTTHEYFPENDPDGDSLTTPAPADSRTLDTVTGGYLKEILEDRTRTDADVQFFDQAGVNRDTGTFHNNDTAPTATDVSMGFTYDDVGTAVTAVNARGMRDDFFVNELSQIVQVQQAADISGASSASPSDPLVGASLGPLTAFSYKSRLYFDYNDQIVLSQTEDRGDTSSVDGLGLGTLPAQATNTTPGLSAADSTGGDAFVDTLSLFDRLNNLIEVRVEVDGTRSLDTKYRYDQNQHLVLLIAPEGNANSWVFDERDLVFQMILGTSTRPTAGLYATGDPTMFDRPGGSGTTTSTFTFNYDDNQNIVDFVDAEDTDGDPSNNSTISGAGDTVKFGYDGYDRLNTVVDPDGNIAIRMFDPDSNVVRTILVGDPSDDVVGQTGNRTLFWTEVIHDSLARPIVTHSVLFETPDGSSSPAPILTDGTSMDSLAAYLSDANSDTAGLPARAIDLGAITTNLTVIGRVSSLAEYDRASRHTFSVEDDLDLYRTDYDGAGRMIRSMDSHVATGFSGGVFTPANQKGNVVLQAYDDNANVIEVREFDVIDIDANGTADSFDANHDGAVNTADTVVDFDLDGTADGDAEVFRTTLIYDSLDRMQTSVDNVSHTLDQRYDSRGQGVSTADAQGPVNTRTISRRWQNPFDSADTDSSAVTVNDFGNVTRRRFDGASRVLESEIILTSSGQGDGVNIGATLEGIQAMSGGDVDYSDVPAKDTSQAADGVISVYFAFDDNNKLLASRDDNGNTTGYIYDNQGRPLTKRRGLAETGTSFTIVGGDSETFVVALRGGTAPVDTESSGTDSTRSFDKDSNVTQLIDESGNTRGYSYDALDRVKSLTVTRASGFQGTTSQLWEYDGLSRLVECFDNNDSGTGDDVTCRYFYDSLSRKVQEGQEIGASTGFKDTSCNYDIQSAGATSKPSQCIYPDLRKVDSTYDNLDRLVGRTDNGQSSAIGTYAYIGKWRVATLTYQNDTRLTHIGQTTSNAQEGFDDLRRITKHRWESFTTPDTTPGNDMLLVGFGHEFGTAGADGRATPAYDRMDNKLIEEKLHDSNSSEVYVYDSAYRLSLPTSTYRSPAPANAYQRGTLNANRDNISTLTTRPGQRQKDDWTLDGPGNWASNPYTDQGAAAVTETQNHTDFNEINQRTIGTDNTTHTLDKNGNITDTGQDVGTGGSRFFGGGLRMEWDALNRLRKVYYNANTPGSTGDDTLIAEYSYDCGNRRMRRVFTNNTAALNGTTDYFYEGWRVVEEHDATDAITQQYVYGTYLDEVWTLDDRRGGASVGDLNDGSGNDRRFYHCNTLYSVFALTDETGAIEEAYQYNAYGTPTVWSGPGTDTFWFTNDDVVSTTTNGAPLSAVDNPYLYTGQRLDSLDLPETGLHYYKNRYLAHDLGRFVSRDPVNIALQGLGLYTYVANGPTSAVDPMGLWRYCTKEDREQLKSKRHLWDKYSNKDMMKYWETGFGTTKEPEFRNNARYSPSQNRILHHEDVKEQWAKDALTAHELVAMNAVKLGSGEGYFPPWHNLGFVFQSLSYGKDLPQKQACDQAKKMWEAHGAHKSDWADKVKKVIDLICDCPEQEQCHGKSRMDMYEDEICIVDNRWFRAKKIIIYKWKIICLNRQLIIDYDATLYVLKKVVAERDDWLDKLTPIKDY